MIQVSGLTKSFGAHVLLDGVGFTVGAGERVGLVGRNGSGKTTLFRMILGEDHADSGAIAVPDGYRIGHVSQHLHFSQPTVLKEACLALPATEDGRDESYKAKTVLDGLGIGGETREQDPLLLSGGLQVRLNLAKALVAAPDMLLLDEPTNYLDIVSIRWLARYLNSWPRELLLITHDRSFMDSVVTHTMGIHRLTIRKYPGTTEKYYTRIHEEDEQYERTRLNDEKKRREAERFINRFRAKATKAKAVQSRIKALDRSQKLDKLSQERDLDFSFKSLPFPGKRVMEAKGLSFGYPGGEKLFDSLNFEIRKGDRIAVIGKNGRGKTTLLNVLAGELASNAGSIQFQPSVKTAYFGQTNIDRLDSAKTVLDELLHSHPDLGIGAARNICGAMLFEGNEALKKIKVLSGGERSRVLLGKLLVSPANLLLLDEPTNHLDMYSIDSLLDAIDAFDGAVVIVTHSELILDAMAERLIVFDGGTVRVYEGGYQEFIERVGWADEAGEEIGQSGAGARKQKPSAQRKDLKRAKAELINERSRTLTPLKDRIAALEAEIMELEERHDRETQELLDASANGDGEAIGRLSASHHATRERIDALFEELATVTEDHDARAKEFEKQLEQIV
jgi:ATP-binding cassette subfamily F protein 3